VLVVAPSNFAADVVVERLGKHMQSHELCRINSHTRHTAVRPSVQRFVYFEPDQPEQYGVPSLYELLQYCVVVVTCGMAGLLVDLGVPSGSFSHILFDESCQALESEALVALALAGPQSTVVLAGDHLQLGAEVHSSVAKALGLQTSWQERLLHTELYQSHLRAATASSGGFPGDMHAVGGCVALRLAKNYRSHEKLLKVSSALFYDGALQPYADVRVTHSLLGWEGLVRRDFPLLVYGVRGADIFEREYSSFSNPTEAAKLVELVQQLLQSSTLRSPTTGAPVLSTNSIGVIAPFRKQVILLRQLLRARGLGAVRVGSVDDYQGAEERVIFLSTVVSRARDDSSGAASGANSAGGSPSDATLPLGILRNARRFNVALSRAQALTVVVGNPDFLAQEDNWRDLLTYAIEERSYAGAMTPTVRAIQRALEAKRTLGGGAMRDANNSSTPGADEEADNATRLSSLFPPRQSESAKRSAQRVLTAHLSASARRGAEEEQPNGRVHDQGKKEAEEGSDEADYDEEWDDEEVDPDDIQWEAENPFFDGSWRLML
jgi:hypothetical protein